MRPPFKNFPELEDDSVWLREISDHDLISILDISYYDGIKAKTLSEARLMNDQILKNYQEGESIHWLIVEKKTLQPAGTCGFYRGFEGNAGEIGCVLLPDFQGKGLMQNALKLVIDFGFQIMNLNRIWSVTDQTNQKAISLMNRLYFQEVKKHSDGSVEFELYQIDSI